MKDLTAPIPTSPVKSIDLVSMALTFNKVREDGTGELARIQVQASVLPAALRDWLEDKIKAHMEEQ